MEVEDLGAPVIYFEQTAAATWFDNVLGLTLTTSVTRPNLNGDLDKVTRVVAHLRMDRDTANKLLDVLDKAVVEQGKALGHGGLPFTKPDQMDDPAPGET